MDQRIVSDERGCMHDHAFNFVADVPTVFHCHHFNLFWDQTIDDALGPALGSTLRFQAAREAYHDLLAGLVARTRASGPGERLDLARTVAMGTGLGDFTFDLDRHGGQALGGHMHYAVAYGEKYGKVQRRTPIDSLACGYVAAASELAFGHPRESVRVKEQECRTLGADKCRFRAELGESGPVPGPMTRSEVERVSGELVNGMFESDIQPIVDGLRGFTAGIRGDDRGLVEAFGLFVTQLPSTYYNRSGYDAMRHLARTAPGSVPIMQALLREAGHVCVFNTFGSIMASPEWEGMVGAPTGDPANTLAGCMALARAFGFGRWAVTEYEPQQRLVIRAPATYESVYHANREGRASEGACYTYQGAGVALMQLVERVRWRDRPSFDQKYYDELFRTGLPWQSEETQCVSRGDSCCEVVVTPKADKSSFMI